MGPSVGDLDEICWHLVTWGMHVTIDQRIHLRRRMATLAAHHVS